MSNLEKELWTRRKSLMTCHSILENDIDQTHPAATRPDNDENCGGTESPARVANEAAENDLVQSYELAKLLFTRQDVYTDLSSNVSFQTFFCPPRHESNPILVYHHGAGSSAMTFYSLVKISHDELGYGAFLFDARGHGDSTKSDSLDFSMALLNNDFTFILNEFYTKINPSNTICLVGHSLGGSVLTHFLATKYSNEEYPTIGGLVVFDIVEELAIRALNSTEIFILRMPKSFGSYAEAVQWHLDSNLLHNYTSAKISVLHLVKESPLGVTWKCQFKSLPRYWDSWFTGMSKKFIESTKGEVSKLLILSTNETLDKELIIGQMQGKFQLIVFNNSTQTGHFIHEDAAKKCLLSVQDFIRRIELAKKIKTKNPWNH